MLRVIFGTVVAAVLFTAGAANGHERGEDVFLQFEFGEYTYPEPSWVAGGISCRGGGRIVRNRGFRQIGPLDCQGRTFVYQASWRGEVLHVHVDSATGRIIGVAP
jgi:hypothetical protein